MNRFTCSTAAILFLCWCNNALSDEYLARHRLFYSPEQRLVLDGALRPIKPDAPIPETTANRNNGALISLPPDLVFNGFLSSPDGETLWINGMPWDPRMDKSVSINGILKLAWKPELNRLTVVISAEDVYYLDPGDSLATNVRASNQRRQD